MRISGYTGPSCVLVDVQRTIDMAVRMVGVSQSASGTASGAAGGTGGSAALLKPSSVRRAPGVAGAGFGALANSHLRRQMGHVFLLCSHVVMHMRWK